MIVVNPLLRIDTYDEFDVAYLVDSAHHYRVSRAVSTRLLDIKISPENERAFFREEEAIPSSVKHQLITHKLIYSASKATSEARCAYGKEGLELREYNWRLAGEYLSRSYGFKFFNYAENGWKKDSEMMSNYLDREDEGERYKVYRDAPVVYQVSLIDKSIEKIDACDRSPSLEYVFEMVAITSGVKKWRPLSRGRSVAHKVVPSGGARHPTEIYILDVKSKSIYHFCFGEGLFTKIKDKGEDFFADCFGQPHGYIPFSVGYVLIFTCVWSRNMFRYRELRTFRSVHMDAGHAVCNIEILCKKCCVKCKVQYGANSSALERLLQIDPMLEGVMCALMIGDGSNL